MRYNFYQVKHCNMCNASEDKFKILGKRLNASQGFLPEKKVGITVSVCKCTSCGLIFSNPQPVPEKISDHYGVPADSYWKEDYFKENPDYFAGEIRMLKELIDISPAMKSLDIGAGIGKQMLALQKAGFDAYGIEPSTPFYERAIERMSIPKEKLLNVSVEEADFPSGFFDFISFGVVLEHIYNPNEALKKALVWLKNDGIIHIEVPNSKWLISKLVNFGYRLTGRDYCTNLSPLHNPFHLYEFSIDSFRVNSLINNYQVAKYGHYVCKTFLPGIFDPLLKSYMRKSGRGMQLHVWLKKP